MGRQFVVQILFGFVCVVFGSCHEPTPSAEAPSMPDVTKPESVRNVDRKCGDQVDNFTARTRRPPQPPLFGLFGLPIDSKYKFLCFDHPFAGRLSSMMVEPQVGLTFENGLAFWRTSDTTNVWFHRKSAYERFMASIANTEVPEMVVMVSIDGKSWEKQTLYAARRTGYVWPGPGTQTSLHWYKK